MPAVPQIAAAQARRMVKLTARIAWIQDFAEQVKNRVDLTAQQRVKIATELVKNSVIRNISVPVVKTPTERVHGKGSYTKVTERSKSGEFPRTDTGQLLRTVMSTVEKTPWGGWVGYIGSPLSYGVILELRMSRSFLVRTLVEEKATVMKILGSPA